MINYLSKEKLNQMSQAGKHQGVIAHAAHISTQR
ncbi:MAG: RNA methyltransferase substrate-binding domain-containing protein [Coprococcus sp.]